MRKFSPIPARLQLFSIQTSLLILDQSCKYGGKEGLIPESTVCKQLHSRHNMLTVSPERVVAYETFLIPSACVCHLRTDYSDYFGALGTRILKTDTSVIFPQTGEGRQ